MGDPLRSWAGLGPSWGSSWAILCHLGAILGHLGPFWGMTISVGNCRESCRIALSCFSGRNAMAQRTLLPVRCLRGRRGHYLHIAVRSCEIERDLYTPHFRTQHRCAKTRLRTSVSALFNNCDYLVTFSILGGAAGNFAQRNSIRPHLFGAQGPCQTTQQLASSKLPESIQNLQNLP